MEGCWERVGILIPRCGHSEIKVFKMTKTRELLMCFYCYSITAVFRSLLTM